MGMNPFGIDGIICFMIPVSSKYTWKPPQKHCPSHASRSTQESRGSFPSPFPA